MIGAGVLAEQEIRQTDGTQPHPDRRQRMTTSTAGRDELAVNTIRTLSMDGVEKAKSGHPGAPMALAPLAYTLFTRVMRHSPSQPDWFDRDRFVLSAGHASMLLYSTLYLSGYGLSLDDLKHFRQLGSPTAGHPEYGHAAGHRGHHRAARPGRRDVGRPGARRGDARRPLQPSRPRADRPPHLGDRERRRHAGGGGLRGLLAGGPPEARQAHGLLRQQPHPAGRQDLDGVLARTWAKRFEAYGWHVQDVGEDLSIESLEGAAEAAAGSTTAPRS